MANRVKARIFVGDEGGAGPGERQAVEGAGAAAHLVHEHQALGGGVVEDVRRLGHFEHEGRAAAGQIVGGADARENAIQGPKDRAPRRHEAADVREDDDERGLAHVGALSAHVRARDDEHAARIIEAQVVGNEGFAAGALDHRMAPAIDQQHRLLDQLRLRAVAASWHARRNSCSTSICAIAAVVACSAGSRAVS